MRKPVYIRCPRCELNYIEKKDKLCSVCKAEMSTNRDDLVSDLDLELCPICKTNYIQPSEIMCANCLKDHQSEDGEISGNDWDEYVNRDEDEIVYDDEETGDMATVANIGDDTLNDDIDTGIGFDDGLDDDLSDLTDDLDDDFDDEEDEDDEDDLDDDLLDDDDDEVSADEADDDDDDDF